MSKPPFSRGSDSRSNAFVNLSHYSMDLYISGYYEGADLLAGNVIESLGTQDTLVYPIAFLYRQFIELSLKDIIRELKPLFGQSSGFPGHHRIVDLWTVARELLTKFVKTDSSAEKDILPDDLNIIEDIIYRFNEVDPNSTAFRYPEDRHGNASLAGVEMINIKELRDLMIGLHDQLVKIDFYIHEIKSFLRDSY